MNKGEFLTYIKNELKDFNHDEVSNILEYYEELINDYIDTGMNEVEAINSLGDKDSIINNLKANLVIERSKDKKTNSLRNFLIILGITTSPILLPLGIVFFIVFLILLLTLLVVFVSFAGSSVVTIYASIYTAFELVANGNDIGTILLISGTTLLVGSILGLLAYGTYKAGGAVLNFINKEFSKMIKRRSKKENMRNV